MARYMTFDELTGANACTLYDLDAEPAVVWRLIDPWLPVGRHGLFLVALSGQRVGGLPKMAMAFRSADGRWWGGSDQETPLDFEPNWFAPAPVHPPCPPPDHPTA